MPVVGAANMLSVDKPIQVARYPTLVRSEADLLAFRVDSGDQ